MCKNARNRCSVFVAMIKHGEDKLAEEVFVRLVMGRKASSVSPNR